MKHTTLIVSNMTCDHCVGAVRRALKAVDGVAVEDVRLGAASVSYDPAVVSQQRIMEAVASAGYEARLEAAGA